MCASTTYNSIRDGKRTRESIRICSVRFRLASAAQRGVRNYDLPFTVFDSSTTRCLKKDCRLFNLVDLYNLKKLEPKLALYHRVNIRFNNDRILMYLKIVFAERTHCIKVIKTISK